MLGIDHIGHTLDAHNTFLWDKEREYSDFLREVYKKIDNETVLIVLADHGMTNEGNHGGDSEEERSTFIFGCTKNSKGFNLNHSDYVSSSSFLNAFNENSKIIKKEQYRR